MEASLSLLAVLNLLGSAQALLLALALLGIRRDDGAANRVLAALVVAMAVVIFGAVMRTTHYEFVFPHLSRIHDPFVFLASPLLFLYLRTLVRRESALKRTDYLHFLPFAACVVYLLPYYLRSSQYKLDYMLAEYYAPTLGPWYYIRSALLLAQGAIYLTLVAALLIRYSRALKLKGEALTAYERAVLFQVRFMLGGFLVLFVGGLMRYTLDQTARTNLLVPLGASALIYALGYLGLRRPEVLTGFKETSPLAEARGANADATGDAPAKKYEKSTLTPERAERYLKRLLTHMETEKPYVDGELTLPKLAERLSIPAQHLSQTINERLQQNFFDFVNTYRVEEAKRRLLDPAKQHYSVLAIAEEVGFNSKSSFNAVFKKHVQMTPSEFRKAKMNAE
ncbi:MAG TPA: helix-turn-helix domain-containing protein [Pyrinomonadaceae bacterium]|nr:helix-turn-helix domain-containing protein [Pyrinomonadaceae bacterium]